MSHPADFAREVDAREAAAADRAAKLAEATDAAERAADDAPLLHPEGVITLTVTGLDPEGREVTRTGRFEYRLPVTARESLNLQVAAQRLTVPGYALPTPMADYLALLATTMRKVPAWIPRGEDGRPDWMEVDASLVVTLAEGVDAHHARFRERVGARREAATSGQRSGGAAARGVGEAVEAAVAG